MNMIKKKVPNYRFIINRIERQVTYWKKAIVPQITNTGLISRVYKGSVRKSQTTQ